MATSDFGVHSRKYGTPPCMGCTNRTVNCHGPQCTPYMEYKARLKEAKDAEKRKNASGNFHEDVYLDIHGGKK